jgi:adenosylcobinamide-phosphate guanylyltransferase
MKIPCLIMAGGKGKRMNLPVEKPLLLFLGKPLIDWVVEAVASSNMVSDFFVVTSKNTPETEKHCQNMGWKILRTDARGYHNDLKQAASKIRWEGPILTIPADLPAVTSEFLDGIIRRFESCEKGFLAVFVPIEAREKLGLSVSSTDEFGGVWYAVSGVNIVDGLAIQGEGKIETSAVITDEIEVLLNINTPQDLMIAQKILSKNTIDRKLL